MSKDAKAKARKSTTNFKILTTALRGVKYERHLHQLMRTPEKLQKETGLNFVLSLLGIFFKRGRVREFCSSEFWSGGWVSYALLAQDGSELHFKGYLDYEGDLVVTRILTGGHGRGAVDKQPGHPKCSRVCAKNSTELLVVTNKSVHILVDRKIEGGKSTTRYAPKLGLCSLKHYGTLHTMDLQM